MSNLVPKVTQHHCCHILGGRSESLFSPNSKGKWGPILEKEEGRNNLWSYFKPYTYVVYQSVFVYHYMSALNQPNPSDHEHRSTTKKALRHWIEEIENSLCALPCFFIPFPFMCFYGNGDIHKLHIQLPLWTITNLKLTLAYTGIRL